MDRPLLVVSSRSFGSENNSFTASSMPEGEEATRVMVTTRSVEFAVYSYNL
jgi:hypothetical protein